MNPELYKAVIEGNPSFLSDNNDQFGILVQVTPNKNTALHVAAQFHDEPEFAKKILMVEPSLLALVNSKGETALLIAARHGHSKTVKSLLTFSKTLEGEDPEGQRRITKEMMGMANEDKDTALLEAVRYNHLNVLKLLLEEEPKLADVVNASMETPLYLGAEKDHHELVEEILKTCESPAYIGPGGRTALHVAIIRGCMRCTKLLMDYIPASLLLKDEYGWTPLHYAAYCGHTKIVSGLLARDSSTAYISAIEDEKHTALHLAAKRGNIEVMEKILSHCPDCWEVVNSRNQNTLHLAVESRNDKAIKYILKQPWLGMLINEKDIDGNTPLHLLCAFNMDVPQLINDCRTDKIAFNKLNLTPLDIEPRMILAYAGFGSKKESIRSQLERAGAKKSWRNIITDDQKSRKRWNEDHVQRLLQPTWTDTLNERKELMEKYNSMHTSHVIVASLIATVAFAAGFTIPGGYNGNEGPEQGMAILARKAAFKAFLIADTVALMSSTSALFLYIYSSSLISSNLDILYYSYKYAFFLDHIAVATMVLAFVSGTIAVLQHSHALIVSVFVLFSVFLFIVHQLLSKFVQLVIESSPTVAYCVALCGIPVLILLQVYKITSRCMKVIKTSMARHT